MSIKQQLYIEIERASPEVAGQLFDFLQLIKQSLHQNDHPFQKIIGSLSNEDADEMRSIIHSEFENIEGEW